MKRAFSMLAFIALAVITSCETKTNSNEGTEVKTGSAETAKAEVAELMDTFHNALKNKKARDFKNLLDNNGLYCGTDPTEIYGRDTYAGHMAETLNHPDLGEVAYTVDKREIRVDESGTTATILEQYKVDLFSPEIPWRLVSHAVKRDGVWIIDFLSFSLVPTNKQQKVINKAVSEK